VRPNQEELIKAIQTGIGAFFAPELQSLYAQSQMAVAMTLFGIAQRDYDSAVPDLVEANAQLRAMLAAATAALAQIDRDDARTAIETAPAVPEPSASLRLSALRAEHDGLRAVLCALAPLIEPAADDPALAPLRPVRAALFAWLSADSKKRVVPILNN
jgi:paraquat-inducible protein B